MVERQNGAASLAGRERPDGRVDRHVAEGGKIGAARKRHRVTLRECGLRAEQQCKSDRSYPQRRGSNHPVHAVLQYFAAVVTG